MAFDYVRFMSDYEAHVRKEYGHDPLLWPWIDREKTEATGVKHSKPGHASRRSLVDMRIERESGTRTAGVGILNPDD